MKRDKSKNKKNESKKEGKNQKLVNTFVAPEEAEPQIPVGQKNRSKYLRTLGMVPKGQE